jgi:toxin ParE1/3/4
MKIDFADEATQRIQEIHDYIAKNKGKEQAVLMVEKIFRKASLLENFPQMGQIEQHELYKGMNVRYLIEGFYKIFYQINSAKGIIEIISVFDTRQHSSKMSSKE